MKQYALNKTILLVDVQESAQDFIVDNGMQYLVWKQMGKQKGVSLKAALEMDEEKLMKLCESSPLITGGKKLPQGNWKLVGYAFDITEEQIAEHKLLTNHPLISWKSFLAKENITNNKLVLIKEK